MAAGLNVWTHPRKVESIQLTGYIPNYITPSRSEMENKKKSIEELYKHLEATLQFTKEELKELDYSEKKAEDLIQQFIEHYKQHSNSLAKFIGELTDN